MQEKCNANFHTFILKEVHIEMSSVTRRGQVVIPSRIRKKFRIKKGARIGFVEADGKLSMQFVGPRLFRRTCGDFAYGWENVEISDAGKEE